MISDNPLQPYLPEPWWQGALNTAQELCLVEQFADAEQLLHALIVDEPYNWDAHLHLADAYIGLERMDLALRHIEMAETLAKMSGRTVGGRFVAMRYKVKAACIKMARIKKLDLEVGFDPIRTEMKSARYQQFHRNMQGIVKGSFAHYLAQNSLDVDLNEADRERLTKALIFSLKDQTKLIREVETFSTWTSHMLHALRAVSVNGAYFEFGVYGGGTGNFIARKIPNKTLHGFDAFQGAPEEYGDGPEPWPNREGELPDMDDNVELYVGWFKDTLPIFTKANDQAVAFAHIDCNLYSSTMVIFEELGDRIRPGTVLVFDEYPGEEYQAFNEFTSANGLEFKYLSCDLNGISLSLVIQ